MSDANISYAAGHIKPLHSPPSRCSEKGRRLREAWSPIYEPALLPSSPDEHLQHFLAHNFHDAALPPLTLVLIEHTLKSMKTKFK
eukprot:6078314-Amphidinium_carterae.1